MPRITWERLNSFSPEPLLALEEQMESAVLYERQERQRAREERKAKKRKRKKKRRTE